MSNALERSVASNEQGMPNECALNRSTTLTIELVDSWDFDTLSLTKEDSFLFLEYLFVNSPESVVFSRIPWATMSFLLHELRRGYRSNPFHRWEHAVDVTHTVYRYLTLSGAHAFLEPTDRMGLLIGAIMHDVGHLGVNNQFMVDSNHELAGLFNDRSPLENFHCFKFFSILKSQGCDIFASLSSSEKKAVRTVIIDTVIHTDNVYHFGMIKELHAFLLTYKKEDPLTPSGRALMNRFFLHSADISNPTKPTALCTKWAYLVMEEFFAQGDQEVLLGLPMQPLNDRSQVNIPQSQLGFIELFVVPLELCKVRLFPTAFTENCLYIVQNMIHWAKHCPKDEQARCKKAIALFEEVVGPMNISHD